MKKVLAVFADMGAVNFMGGLLLSLAVLTLLFAVLVVLP